MTPAPEAYLKSKLTAGVVLGMLSAWWVHFDYVTWARRGREAFLAHEAMRFDTYMASQRPLVFTVVGALMAVSFFLGVYEVLVFLFSKVLEPRPGATRIPS